MKKYNLITFEGIDGSGKSTAIYAARDFLISQGKKVFITTETNNKEIPFFRKMREIVMFDDEVDIKTEMFIFAALRNEHFEKVIDPKINDGYIVLCDRFIDSSMVYQKIKGMNQREIEIINEIATNNREPEITFLFDLEVDTAIQRVIERNEQETKFDHYSSSFFFKAREEYLKLAAQNQERIKIINSNLDKRNTYIQMVKRLEEWLK